MTLPLVIDGEIDSISGYGSCSDEFNIYKGSIGSIYTYDGNVDISGGNIGDLYTDGSPSITISGGIIGAMEIRGIGGRLTITGGSFPGNVSIDCMYHGFKVAISGGLFGGDLNLFSNPGLIDLVFYGELELVLGDRWIESEYKAYAEYAINGTLRDGSPLSALTNCECSCGQKTHLFIDINALAVYTPAAKPF